MSKRNKTASGKNLKKTTQLAESKNGETTDLAYEIESHGFELLTLMEVTDRAKLPRIPNTGRPCTLVEIATENPDEESEDTLTHDPFEQLSSAENMLQTVQVI